MAGATFYPSRAQFLDSGKAGRATPQMPLPGDLEPGSNVWDCCRASGSQSWRPARLPPLPQALCSPCAIVVISLSPWTARPRLSLEVN